MSRISSTARSPAKAIPGTTGRRLSSGPGTLPHGLHHRHQRTRHRLWAARSGCYKAIREIIEKYDPPAVFVYQTCVTALIGDDIDAVCKAAREKFGKPVIPVNAPGFVGVEEPRQQARRRGAARPRHRHRRSRTTRRRTTSTSSANTTSRASCGRSSRCSMQWACGCSPASAAMRDYREVACSHRARATMMVCSKAMINVARKMEERYGIPYLRGLVLRHRRHVRRLRQIAPPAGRARRARRADRRAPRR